MAAHLRRSPSRYGHLRTRWAPGVGAVVLLLALPATASAATTVRISDLRYGPPRSETTLADVVLQGDEAPSDLTIELQEGSVSDGDVVEGGVLVTDPNGVVPGQNCASVPDAGGTSVLCRLPSGTSLSGEMTAGGGDDRIDVDTGRIDVEAGAGDDVVSGAHAVLGGPGADELSGARVDGGPGADVLEGTGDGFLPTLVDLSARTEPVRFSLIDGEEGDGDRLVNVGGVIGGASDDELTGSARDDIMLGGPGDDTITGSDGDDQVADWVGDNTIEGEGGEDTLVTDAGSRISESLRRLSPVPGGRGPRRPEGRSVVLAGAGDDTVISGPGADRLDPGEGDDTVLVFEPPISGGADTVWLRDGAGDEVVCDPRTTVRADSRDHAAGCARIERTGSPRPRLVYAGNPELPAAGGPGLASIGCSDDHTGRCRGLVRVYVLNREVGRTRFSIAAGTFDAVRRFPLADSVRRAVRERGLLRASYRVDTRDARGRPVVLRGTQTLCADRNGSDACDPPDRPYGTGN